jgi:hypothetical protein
MDFRYFCIVLLFTIPLFLKAQNSGISNSHLSDYHHFKNVLESETGTLADTQKEGFEPVKHPAILPDSLQYFPDARKNEVIGLGISDPGMDEESAFQLAMERAAAVTAILTGAGIKSLVDNYSSETDRERSEEFVTKYLNYFRIDAAKMLDPEGIRIVWKYRTPFDETIVLTAYTPGSTDTGISIYVEAEVYQVERQKGKSYWAEERIGLANRLESIADTTQTEYAIYARNNLLEIVSKPGGQEYAFPYRNFRYSMGNSNDEINTGFSSRLNYGLWKSFLELFLQQAYLSAQQTHIHIKQVGDAYADKTQHLSREIYTDAPVFALRGIRIYENHLSIQFNQLQNHVTDQ